jgi:hypothetical protein
MELLKVHINTVLLCWLGRLNFITMLSPSFFLSELHRRQGKSWEM